MITAIIVSSVEIPLQNGTVNLEQWNNSNYDWGDSLWISPVPESLLFSNITTKDQVNFINWSVNGQLTDDLTDHWKHGLSMYMRIH